MRLVIEQSRSSGVMPQEAARGFLVPRDPYRGEVAALVAIAPSQTAVPWLVGMLDRLATTAIGWFADNGNGIASRPSEVGTAKDESPTNRDQVCSNVVVMACRLARSDVAIEFFRWYSPSCRITIRTCLRAAVDQDDGILVSAMLCHTAQQRDVLPGCDRAAMGTLFRDALATAALHGKINALQCLMAKSGRDSKSHLAACRAAQDNPSEQNHWADHDGCAFAASRLHPHTILHWDFYAAVHNQVDVFVQAATKGWYYGTLHVVALAVVYGSTDVADFVALEDDPAMHSPLVWAKAIADAITYRYPYIHPATDATRLARGMAWLCARGVQFALKNTVYMARQIEAYPDLVQCVLAMDTPLPNTVAPPFLGGRCVRDLVWRGQWTVLSRVIVAYGRAADEARSRGKHPTPTKWWTHIEKMVYIKRTPNGLCLSRPDTRAVRALCVLYRIARLCGRIPPSPTDSVLSADMDIGHSPDDVNVDPACWVRWCDPIPLWCDVDTYHGKVNDGTCDSETCQRVARMLILLADAGLVTTDRPAPIQYDGFAPL